MVLSLPKATIGFKNLKKGNEVNVTMWSGEMVIGDSVIPYVLRHVSRGSIKKVAEGEYSDLSIVDCGPYTKTAFSERGYVSLLLTFAQLQVSVYIKRNMSAPFSQPSAWLTYKTNPSAGTCFGGFLLFRGKYRIKTYGSIRATIRYD